MPSLQRQLIAGSAWSVALRWSIRATGLVSTVIFARLLSPDDFGLFAMGMLIVGFVEMLNQTGQAWALIRHPNPTREHYDAAWTLSVCIGIAICVVVFAIAPLGLVVFHDERVVTLIRAFAFRALIAGFQNVGVVEFQRNLQFQLEFRYLLSQRLSMFVFTLAAVLVLRDYWGLVLGMYGGKLTGIALSYYLHPFRPRFSFAKMRDIASFSLWTLVGNLGEMLSERSDEFIVGSISIASGLGYYHVASDTARAPTLEILSPLTRTLFPVYAKFASDTAKLKNAYLDVLSVVATIAFATGAGVWLVAHDLVVVVLGAQWTPAIPLFGWLAVAGSFFGIVMTVVTIFSVVGYARFSARLIWARTLLLIPATLLAAHYSGIEAVAMARCVVLGLSIPLMLVSLNRVFPLSIFETIGQLWRPAAATLLMVAILRALYPHLPEVPIERLPLTVMGGALTYSASLLGIWVLSGRPAGLEKRLADGLARLKRRRSAA